MDRNQIRRKQTLVVGRRYRGSGIINAYGEVQFTAYQEGTASQNALKKVTGAQAENSQWALYASGDLISIRLTCKKQEQTAMEDVLRDSFIKSLIALEKYEI